MLTFRLHMEFTPQTCDEAAAVLRSLVGPVRSEQGCSATRLLRDTEDGCGLTWEEEWRSDEDFERHLRATAFRQILAVIELAAEPPAVEIDDVTSRRGFELVEEILALTPAERTEYETG
jgi:quinol monooxygenase YgiN